MRVRAFFLIFLAVAGCQSTSSLRQPAQNLPEFTGGSAGAITSPLTNARMGPEIEFRGLKHLPALLCSPAGPGTTLRLPFPTVVSGAATVGFTASVIAQAKAGENASPKQIATGGLAALSFGSLLYFILCDSVVTGSYSLYMEDLYALLEKKCAEEKNCRLSRVTRRYRARVYEDIVLDFDKVTEINRPFQIRFTHDPSVVEVHFTPLNSEEAEKMVPFLDKNIYQNTARVGLKIPRIDGPWNGGHIHIDLETAFGPNDWEGLRNFVADLGNHQELSDGILGWDPVNAKTTQFSDEHLINLRDLIEDLDNQMRGEARPLVATFREKSLGGFYGAFRFNIVYNTIELRFPRSQSSARELALLMKLINGRIRYIRSLPKGTRVLLLWREGALTAQEKMNRFYQYARESGLDNSEIKELVPARFKKYLGRALKLKASGPDCVVAARIILESF
jgi:hypothetical protein